ncbi:RNA-binding protein 2-like isoform X1 [Apium graveolens]|uniref:RNA-binding protein 2-like isoform X1 n=1 Tax=Apium graveolens TaxID=4045 RepID=UPI003D79A4E9
MADPYWRYSASSADRSAAAPPSSFPGYLPSSTSALPVHHAWASSDLHGSSSDILQKDILPLRTGAYSVDDIMGVGARSDPALGGYMTGTSMRSYTPSVEDTSLLASRRDVTLGSALPGVLNERPASFGNIDDLPVSIPASKKESNVLFVDGLPNDCTRREVGHLFRPFIGFREIRVVHKEPRRAGDKAMVLCFVEFTDAKCALTALEALQGYKFDNKKPDSPVLSIHFAHFPFRLPSGHEKPRFAGAL